mmetsp:Transcript_5855/g.20001  ORF Transcript_5855/g.20001 Transcript_5855/m.20001 type:complete len:334 (+) Transcript_5855:341-1342(+)
MSDAPRPLLRARARPNDRAHPAGLHGGVGRGPQGAAQGAPRVARRRRRRRRRRRAGLRRRGRRGAQGPERGRVLQDQEGHRRGRLLARAPRRGPGRPREGRPLRGEDHPEVPPQARGRLVHQGDDARARPARGHRPPLRPRPLPLLPGEGPPRHGRRLLPGRLRALPREHRRQGHGPGPRREAEQVLRRGDRPGPEPAPPLRHRPPRPQARERAREAVRPHRDLRLRHLENAQAHGDRRRAGPEQHGRRHAGPPRRRPPALHAVDHRHARVHGARDAPRAALQLQRRLVGAGRRLLHHAPGQAPLRRRPQPRGGEDALAHRQEPAALRRVVVF